MLETSYFTNKNREARNSIHRTNKGTNQNSHRKYEAGKVDCSCIKYLRSSSSNKESEARSQNYANRGTNYKRTNSTSQNGFRKK